MQGLQRNDLATPLNCVSHLIYGVLWFFLKWISCGIGETHTEASSPHFYLWTDRIEPVELVDPFQFPPGI